MAGPYLLGGSSGRRAACSYAATGGRRHASLAEPMAGDRLVAASRMPDVRSAALVRSAMFARWSFGTGNPCLIAWLACIGAGSPVQSFICHLKIECLK